MKWTAAPIRQWFCFCVIVIQMHRSFHWRIHTGILCALSSISCFASSTFPLCHWRKVFLNGNWDLGIQRNHFIIIMDHKYLPQFPFLGFKGTSRSWQWVIMMLFQYCQVSKKKRNLPVLQQEEWWQQGLRPGKWCQTRAGFFHPDDLPRHWDCVSGKIVTD